MTKPRGHTYPFPFFLFLFNFRQYRDTVTRDCFFRGCPTAHPQQPSICDTVFFYHDHEKPSLGPHPHPPPRGSLRFTSRAKNGGEGWMNPMK
jgi:hypothetical protein